VLGSFLIGLINEVADVAHSAHDPGDADDGVMGGFWRLVLLLPDARAREGRGRLAGVNVFISGPSWREGLGMTLGIIAR
jgi:hypothetical protein